MSLNTLTQIVVKGILVADELWSVNSSVISSDRVSSPQIGGCDLDVLVRQRGFSSHVLSFAIVGTPYLRIMAGAITHGTRGRDGRGKSVGQSSCSGGRGKKALCMDSVNSPVKKQPTPAAKAEATGTQLAETETQGQSTKRQQFRDPPTERKKKKGD
ncbi:hypothetical protein Tco_1393459 [Tanacetum coccineum]